jgi:hypothetical protein
MLSHLSWNCYYKKAKNINVSRKMKRGNSDTAGGDVNSYSL